MCKGGRAGGRDGGTEGGINTKSLHTLTNNSEKVASMHVYIYLGKQIILKKDKIIRYTHLL